MGRLTKIEYGGPPRALFCACRSRPRASRNPVGAAPLVSSNMRGSVCPGAPGHNISPMRPSSTGVAAHGPLVFVHSSDELYGADRMLLEMVDAARADPRVTSLEVWLPIDLDHPAPELSLCGRLEERGVTVRHLDLPVLRRSYRTPAGIARLAARGARLLAELRRVRATTVYCTSSATLLAAPVARLAGVPCVVGHVQEIWTAADRSVLTPPARCCRQLVAVSEAAARSLPAGLVRRTTVVTNGSPDPGPPVPLDRPHGPAPLPRRQPVERLEGPPHPAGRVGAGAGAGDAGRSSAARRRAASTPTSAGSSWASPGPTAWRWSARSATRRRGSRRPTSSWCPPTRPSPRGWSRSRRWPGPGPCWPAPAAACSTSSRPTSTGGSSRPGTSPRWPPSSATWTGTASPRRAPGPASRTRRGSPSASSPSAGAPSSSGTRPGRPAARPTARRPGTCRAGH